MTQPARPAKAARQRAQRQRRAQRELAVILGERIARENAEREIWPLLGFRLRDQLAYAKALATA